MNQTTVRKQLSVQQDLLEKISRKGNGKGKSNKSVNFSGFYSKKKKCKQEKIP